MSKFDKEKTKKRDTKSECPINVVLVHIHMGSTHVTHLFIKTVLEHVRYHTCQIMTYVSGLTYPENRANAFKQKEQKQFQGFKQPLNSESFFVYFLFLLFAVAFNLHSLKEINRLINSPESDIEFEQSRSAKLFISIESTWSVVYSYCVLCYGGFNDCVHIKLFGNK